MNKVICDVCGTSYPETSAHCPICGCAKTSVDRTSAGEEDGGYAYVKGGRFSKKNVRKRTSGSTPERVSTPARRPQERSAQPERQDRPSRRQHEPEEQSNTGLILVVIFLLIAIIAVVIYIGMRVFGPDDSGTPKDPISSQITNPTNSATATGPSSGTTVPCESLQLSDLTLELDEEIPTWTLQVRTTPESTTDTISFTSSDPSVVTVNENGELVAVGSGTATITVTCGSVTEICTVTCSFGSDPEPTDPVVPVFEFEFNTRYYMEDVNKWDITLKRDQVWKCYKNDLSVDPSAITWSSDNPAVCTINNGVVTVVGPGQTDIHAQYAGKTYTCVIRVSKSEYEDVGGEDNPGGNTSAYTINKNDVTISVGESFTLKLSDASGNALDVTWTADNTALVTINGNKITGAAPGIAKVSTTYEGVTYTCIVRVN